MQTQMENMDEELQQMKFDLGGLFNKAKNFLGGLFRWTATRLNYVKYILLLVH